jgi:uncharacterized protein YxjI
MIFCERCGRYYKEGTVSCDACHADLRISGHTSFGGRPAPVRAAAIPKEPSRPAVPVARAVSMDAVPAEAVSAAVSGEAAHVSSAPSAEAAHISSTPTAVAVIESEIDEAFDPPENENDPVFDRDKFLLRQKALAIKEKYYVTDEAGQPLLFVERPALLTQQLIMLAAVAATFFGGRFLMTFVSGFVGPMLGGGLGGVLDVVGLLAVIALSVVVFVLLIPKRHVTFYRDDTKREKILEIRQLNKIEFPFANFSILDTTGKVVGSLRKNVLFDYVRRRWQVRNGYGVQVCMAKEDSIILSLLRRTGIPIFALLRTNFVFLRGQDVIGEFNRKFTLLDRYVLDLTADRNRTLDRRIALALGVMLDTGERR